MNIKQAALEDLDSVAELFDLYRGFYQQKSDLEGAREFIRERMSHKESVIFVAFDGNEALGFTQLYPMFSSVRMNHTWVLNDLFVKKDARGRGIGEQLLKKAIDFAKETGAVSVTLETGPENKRAQKLYEKTGFKREANYFYGYKI
ncbi:MAG: GNAT family N-acetyltransferase [Bacillaceae bacterium]|nr:GNAT family N-acetyltransferase [Bacillaceae bacterium]